MLGYDTAVIDTCRQPTLLVKYLEAYLSDLERWLNEWRIAINDCSSPRPVDASRNCEHYSSSRRQSNGSMTRYLGMTLDKRLTWSKYIDQVRKRVGQRRGILGPLLHRRSSLSITNGVLLYKQLIRPMTDYACPDWRSDFRSHIKKLQVL